MKKQPTLDFESWKKTRRGKAFNKQVTHRRYDMYGRVYYDDRPIVLDEPLMRNDGTGDEGYFLTGFRVCRNSPKPYVDPHEGWRTLSKSEIESLGYNWDAFPFLTAKRQKP